MLSNNEVNVENQVSLSNNVDQVGKEMIGSSTSQFYDNKMIDNIDEDDDDNDKLDESTVASESTWNSSSSVHMNEIVDVIINIIRAIEHSTMFSNNEDVDDTVSVLSEPEILTTIEERYEYENTMIVMDNVSDHSTDSHGLTAPEVLADVLSNMVLAIVHSSLLETDNMIEDVNISPLPNEHDKGNIDMSKQEVNVEDQVSLSNNVDQVGKEMIVLDKKNNKEIDDSPDLLTRCEHENTMTVMNSIGDGLTPEIVSDDLLTTIDRCEYENTMTVMNSIEDDLTPEVVSDVLLNMVVVHSELEMVKNITSVQRPAIEYDVSTIENYDNRKEDNSYNSAVSMEDDDNNNRLFRSNYLDRIHTSPSDSSINSNENSVMTEYKKFTSYSNNYRVYLDRIYTSPHTPKPSGGGIGYSSKKILPSLEHTGIYSSFDPKPASITDSYGRITQEYKWNACIKVGKIEKKNVKVKHYQPFFKSNHYDFLNKVLCEMEDHRSYKIERNRRRWMEGKNEIGFGNHFKSYENALMLGEERMGSNTPTLGYKFDKNLSDKTAESSTFLTSDSFVELPSVEYNRTVSFSIEKDDNIFPECPGNDKYNDNDNNSLNSSISTLSLNSTKSKSSQTFTGEPRRKRNAINRMSLFECLLETTEPPTSPIKRYGSYSPWSQRSITTASSLDSRGTELVQNGLKRWSERSIHRANTGD